MSTAVVSFRGFELPWTLGRAQDQEFWRVARKIALAVLVLSLIMPWLPTWDRSADEAVEMPPRYAKLILEKKPPPKPAPPPEIETPAPEPKPEKVVEAKPDPKPVEKPDRPAPKNTPKAPPKPTAVAQARDTASRAGVLAFADDLADLRARDSTQTLAKANTRAAGPGNAPKTERSMITSRLSAGSGGVNTAALSRNTGGGGLAGRSTTNVESSLGSGSGGVVAASGGTGGDGRGGGSRLGSRSEEEIELVFDKNKSAIFALYNRALRRNPALEGKLVLQLTIAPSGVVTDCEVVSSELGDSELERKLVQRVKLFRFEDKDVREMTTIKPIDFFPA